MNDRSLQEELLSHVKHDRRYRIGGEPRQRATTVGVVPTRMLIDAADRLDKQEFEIERLHIEVANRAHSEQQYLSEIEQLRVALDRAERTASLTAAASSVAGEAVRKMQEAEAEVERLSDKALRFDLDQDGIEYREGIAVALVEAKAEIARQEQAIERLGRESASDHNRWATERINLLTEIERLREDIAQWLEGQGQPGYAHEVRYWRR